MQRIIAITIEIIGGVVTVGSLGAAVAALTGGPSSSDHARALVVVGGVVTAIALGFPLWYIGRRERRILTRDEAGSA